MTPKEIVERVRRTRFEISSMAMCGLGDDSAFYQNSDIDHLLAIHAAVIALFDALADCRSVDSAANILQQRAAVQARRDELEALCGWKAEETK